MKYFSLIFILFLFSCGGQDPEKLRAYEEKLMDSIQKAEERKMLEEKAANERATLILDNPTSSPIVYSIGNKKDTLAAFVYREEQVPTGDQRFMVYGSNGEVKKDTGVYFVNEEKVFANIAFSNYLVLMMQYKDFDFSVLDKTPEQLMIDQALRYNQPKKKHEYATPLASGDQNRSYDKKTFTRPSTTNSDYIVTSYYMYTRIDKKEFLVHPYWDFDPRHHFEASENVSPKVNDAYLRQLTREKDMSFKCYAGSSNTSDWISAVINMDFLNEAYHATKMIASYDKKKLQEISASCADCAEFIKTANKLSGYLQSTQGLTALSKNNQELMKTLNLKEAWQKCKSSQGCAVPLFDKEHQRQFDLMSGKSFY